MHKACGAYVGDREQHERVCTAPPWQPRPFEPVVHDFLSDGTVT
jgi:hypothetical protein